MHSVYILSKVNLTWQYSLFAVAKYSWVLYTSNTASAIFDKLNSEQTKMITDYVDPEYWFRKLHKNKEDVDWVSEILGKVDLA